MEKLYWKKLSKCCQEEFVRSGAAGKCIEARELIIALPEEFVEYNPKELLERITSAFAIEYRADCVAALHHNKKKTNYHIHLIFSERELLEKPIEKIAIRNMFYNEESKHVRTKKEILDENGKIRKGCKIVRKGDIYEKKYFDKKKIIFKSKEFLDDVKILLTKEINTMISDENRKLNVFDNKSPYLPTKKVGKNNPKEKLITEDNNERIKWNNLVDRGYIVGVEENKMIWIKKEQIIKLIREVHNVFKNIPNYATDIIKDARDELKKLIVECTKKQEENQFGIVEIITKQKIEKKLVEVDDKPRRPKELDKLQELNKLYRELNQINNQIVQIERMICDKENEMNNIKGIFTGKQKKEIQDYIDKYNIQKSKLNKEFIFISKQLGHENIKELVQEINTLSNMENSYKDEMSRWMDKEIKRRYEIENVCENKGVKDINAKRSR